jgi:hypothetical protein
MSVFAMLNNLFLYMRINCYLKFSSTYSWIWLHFIFFSCLIFSTLTFLLIEYNAST